MTTPTPRLRDARAFLFVYGMVIAAFAASAILGLDAARVALKPVPVLVLAVWVRRAAARDGFASRLLFGLVLCALGDVVIETGRFVPGLAAFLVGHLGYIAAFVHEDRALRPERAALFAAWGVIAIALLWSGLGEMKVPVVLYTATICAMMWRASALRAVGGAWTGLVLAGAVLFAISDTVIAIDRFRLPFAAARVVILSLYWLGQLLIAGAAVVRPARD